MYQRYEYNYKTLGEYEKIIRKCDDYKYTHPFVVMCPKVEKEEKIPDNKIESEKKVEIGSEECEYLKEIYKQANICLIYSNKIYKEFRLQRHLPILYILLIEFTEEEDSEDKNNIKVKVILKTLFEKMSDENNNDKLPSILTQIINAIVSETNIWKRFDIPDKSSRNWYNSGLITNNTGATGSSGSSYTNTECSTGSKVHYITQIETESEGEESWTENEKENEKENEAGSEAEKNEDEFCIILEKE